MSEEKKVEERFIKISMLGDKSNEKIQIESDNLSFIDVLGLLEYAKEDANFRMGADKVKKLQSELHNSCLAQKDVVPDG